MAEAGSPHVVLLVLDDIGWADVGYHGSNFPTPNIDRLAATGIKLERMYVMPQCSPTRAAIMTGRYSFRTGLQHFTTILPGTTPGIPEWDKTLAETFKAGGYATHMIGKWHIGYSKWSQTPLGKGFDSFYGYLQGEVDYYNRTLASCEGHECLFRMNEGVISPFGPGAAAYDFWDEYKPVVEDFGKYTVDAYDAHLDQVLSPYGTADAPSKPLFLYFAEQQMHIPIEAPPQPEHLEACRGVTGGEGQVNRTVLCSMASRLDESMGRLEKLIRKYGIWDNTLIFAVSDNGGMTQWGRLWPASASSNWPLRGGKTTVFEGGVRSVSFVNGGALPAAARGSTSKQLLHAVDILPTLASFAGVPLLTQGDGLDVWPAISAGAPVNRKELPLNIGVNPLGGLPWSTPGLVHDGATNYSALISWPWKVVVGDPYVIFATKDDRRRDGWWSIEGYQYTAPTEEMSLPYRLYNLEDDEAERKNLADNLEHQDLLKQLIERVKWYASSENGWVKPQSNVPQTSANPRFHNWIWLPFLREGEEASQ